MSLHQHSSSAEKIARFRDLFRGRSDVFPQRFESAKTGRAGYSPACANEWIKGICEKPRIKCSDCPHQKWIPVDDHVIRWHLSGMDSNRRPFVMGVYPMLPDESCHFLAIDFDGDHWLADIQALASVVKELRLPLAMERSRSGEGAHLWLFFEQAIPASIARRLGAYLLSETMDRRPEIGMASYDRMFPNQDTLPKGGFGNLIALPLQKAARDKGNSVFIDETFMPFEDQWGFLGGLAKIPFSQVDHLVRSAEKAQRTLPVRAAPSDSFQLKPWTAPPSRRMTLPPIVNPPAKRIDMVLADEIYIPKTNLPPALQNRILQLAAFQNPEFYKAQAMRLPTYDKPRVIACAELHAEHISLPRGCLDELCKLMRDNKVSHRIKDHRFAGIPLNVTFRGELRSDQQRAAQDLIAHDTGILAATTAFGKTVLAAWMIAARGVNTLVLVHRQQLMDQWVARLVEFLGIPENEIGRLGGGRRKLKGKLDVALIQSMVRKGTVDDRVADYGHLIVDECHHLSAHSFELAARRAKAKYILGLSATIERKDGHEPIIFMQCGPVRHSVSAKDQAEERPFQHQVVVRPTSFRSTAPPSEDARIEFQSLCKELSEDDVRNRMIASDISRAYGDGRNLLVLTERTEHLDAIKRLLSEAGIPVAILMGSLCKKERRIAMEQISHAEQRIPVILATGRFIGEGFDMPQLDTLFVTLPVSWRGTISQYAGRLHRLHTEKRLVQIYDYADLDTPMLSRMFDKRCAGYEVLGYSILLPGSALPGWPQTVPLPVDPTWKRQYAATVKRLILDGVDIPLAELFVHVAQPPHDEPRARSAAEAFLHRRLQTLEATRDRFRLNAKLPIPFDLHGQMEVDFLCTEARLVIELDGPQHLGDPDAWRSDRRKDQLLQRHGYFILRFLTSDLGENLPAVLDTLLTALASRVSKMP